MIGTLRRTASGILRRQGRRQRGRRGWVVEPFHEAHLPEWLRVATRRRGRPDDAEKERWRSVAAGESPWVAGIVRQGQRIVGSVLVDGERPPTIWDLWVDPRSRGRGYGRALVAWGVRVAEDRGEEALEAHVRPGSDSWRVFRDAGFRVHEGPTPVTPEHLVLRFEYDASRAG